MLIFFISIPALMIFGWVTTNHFGPWVSWHSELPFFAIGILLSIGLMRARMACISFNLQPVALLPILLLTGITLAQWVCGVIIWRGQLLVILLYLALGMIAILWGRYERAVVDGLHKRFIILNHPGEWMAWSIIICGVLTWFLMAAQIFELWEGQSWIVRMPFVRRPGGNVGQSNHAATLMVMAVGAVIYLYSKSRFEYPIAVGILILLLSGIAITESRSGLLSVLLLSIWIGCSHVVSGLRRRVLSAALLALVSILLFVFWPTMYSTWQISDSYSGGLGRISQSTRDSRLTIWSQLIDATMLHPWLGWGVRNTAVAMNAIADGEATSFPLTYSHNIILDLAIWMGWPLTIVVVLFVGWWIFGRLVVRKSPLGFFGGALFIPFMIHSLLEFPFAYAYLLLPSMIGVGYIEATFSRNRAKEVMSPLLSWVLGLYLLLIGGLVVVDYLKIEEDFRDARFQILKIGPNLAESRGRIYVLNQLESLIQSMRIEIQPGMQSNEIEMLRNVAANNPWSATQYRYAMALALNGSRQEAIRQLNILSAQHGEKVEAVFRKQINDAIVIHGGKPLSNH